MPGIKRLTRTPGVARSCSAPILSLELTQCLVGGSLCPGMLCNCKLA